MAAFCLGFLALDPRLECREGASTVIDGSQLVVMGRQGPRAGQMMTCWSMTQ